MGMNENPTPAAMPHVEIYTDGGCEPNPGPGGYGVLLLHPKKRAEGSKRLTTVCDHQGDAIAAGREIARNQHSELRIQGRDGKFREAWSYGNDPFPPRG